MSALLVNPITAVVHRPSCIHAAGCIPWEGFTRASGDRACVRCQPELEGDS